jgi:hypothetical protein
MNTTRSPRPLSPRPPQEGFNSNDERGIIPRAIEQIFRHIQTSMSPRMRFLVRASYLQIYNEVISDLLKPERSNLLIREDKKKGVFVEGLSEWVVRSPAEIYGLMERGGAMRATGSTKMNELSSRSHAVFIIIAEQSETTYLDEAGREMSVEEFHRLVKSRAHGENALKALETNVRQSFKVSAPRREKEEEEGRERRAGRPRMPHLSLPCPPPHTRARSRLPSCRWAS